ncbi:MAG: hypothetical protein FWC76_06050 [Defluviitaleaceae bacterium]|nr:hypothetical protein [Defluviitaleaceae bacterium]
MMNLTFFAAGIGAFWNVETAIVCVIIGLAIAGAIMFVKRSKLKSVRRERTACNYVRSGSFRLVAQKDTFLYANTTRTPRSQGSSAPMARRSVGGRRR